MNFLVCRDLWGIHIYQKHQKHICLLTACVWGTIRIWANQNTWWIWQQGYCFFSWCVSPLVETTCLGYGDVCEIQHLRMVHHVVWVRMQLWDKEFFFQTPIYSHISRDRKEVPFQNDPLQFMLLPRFGTRKWGISSSALVSSRKRFIDPWDTVVLDSLKKQRNLDKSFEQNIWLMGNKSFHL